MTRSVRALGAVAVLCIVLCGWWSTPAGAHALLIDSVPADGASVDKAPSQLVLTFTEPPDVPLSVVHVLDASGKQVENGKPQGVPGQAAQLSVPLGTLAQGAYTVTWRTTSAVDGHTTVGSIAFGVGVPAPVAGADGVAAAPSAPRPTPAGVAGRWLFYVGTVLLLGAATVGVLVASDPRTIPRMALAGAWGLSVAGIVLTVADQRAVARTTLSNLLGSSTGHKLTTQAIAVGLAGLAVAWAGTRRTRPSLAVLGAAAAAVMLARALAGHADASTVRWFTVGTQWIHLVSVGAWVGGLVWLLVVMRKGDPGQGRGLARRFSTVAAWTLVVVAASGTARAVDEVGAWDRLVHTSFGQALLVKLAFFAALVALGALSRYRHVPAATADGRLHGLRRVVRGEVAIGAGVLGATAVLAGLPPSALVAEAAKPSAPPAVTVTGNDYATSVRVRLVVTPGLPGPNRFDATVADYDSGKPLAAETVQLRFQASDHPDVAPATLDLARDASGRWGGFGRGLSIAGRWSVTAVVQTGADAVEVPMELQTRQPITGSTGTGNDAAVECGEGQPDASYTVSIDFEPDPPRAEGTVLHMTVRHDGKVVTGAKVCLTADMPDMQHPGISGVAKEAPGGRYDANLKFSMGGAWAASIRIVEPGKPVVLVPVKFDVK